MGRVKMALAAATMLVLSSCGSSDADERKAFTGFLQTRVLDKPGMHVPQLTKEERASFGDYADQYAVITDFNKAMDGTISPKLKAATQAGAITSLQDIVTHRAQLQAARSAIQAMGRSLGDRLAQADAAHSKLDQPADVKVVYDKAYDRLVTQPAAALKSIVPIADKVLGEAIDLGTYIDAHRAAVQLSGSMIQTSDSTVQAGINARIQSMQAGQQAVQAAQQRIQSVAYGSASQARNWIQRNVVA